MSSKNKDLSEHQTFAAPNASIYKIGIVVSEYHHEITSSLQKAAVETLTQYGVNEQHIFIHSVPGAYELPLAAKWLHISKRLDAVLCLGCVIKGETAHDVYINQSVAQAIMDLSLKSGCPFIFGLLTPNTLQQAKDRAGGKYGNKGTECAVVALRMLILKNNLNFPTGR